MNIPCSYCGEFVNFSENPYGDPTATRYWQSTYEEPEQSLFVVQRKTPSVNKKGKVSVKVTNEHITAVFCGPECGLGYHGDRKKVSASE